MRNRIFSAASMFLRLLYPSNIGCHQWMKQSVTYPLKYSEAGKYHLVFLHQQQKSCFCTVSSLSLHEYTVIVDDTLEELADHFDHLADEGLFSDDYDCILADGVMTVKLGEYGTYVVNKQTPNRQMWLSSPVSGPKRYDLVDNAWYYSHEPNRSLHELLSDELSELTKRKTDFTHLTHGKKSVS